MVRVAADVADAVFDLIDIGVNLTHDSFDHDRGEVIERAAAQGVRRLIVTGTSVTTSVSALSLPEPEPGRLYATAGIHPHHAREFDEHSIGALQPLLDNSRVVAVGECGLDFFRDFSPRDMQERAFAAQLELAAASWLPVFLHQRDAHEMFVAMLRDVRDRLSGGVAHCFTGGPEQLRDCLDLDLHVGITGWVCDERRGGALRAALPDVPLDRLLIETDAPYLLPRDLKPKPKTRRNEPCHLRHVLERIAAEMGQLPEVVARAATSNTERLFGIPPRRDPA